MTKRRWTEEDEEAQERDNRQAAGCLGDAGCLGIGCLANTLPVLLAFLWLFP